MTIFQRWYRTRLFSGDDQVTVATDAAAPVRTQQALSSAVTMVGEVTLASVPSGLVTGSLIRIDQLDLRAPDTDDTVPVNRQFTGTVNIPSGDSSPQAARLTCTGYLSRLRRVPLTNHDLTGMTDQEAVQTILDLCNVPFDPDDILGWGYVLGQVQGVVWTPGTSGASMVGELDRVFNCATLELGSGRVFRIPYNRSPYQYPSPTYAATYRKGTPGLAFYANTRTRGDLDQIRNYWQVQGLSWQGEEGAADEGVRYQVYATAQAEHALLGPDVYLGPDTFSSDLIQTEDLAKAIAIRLMQETNREPDNVRIDGGNNLAVVPGCLILEKDPTPGVDLATDKRYLVTSVTRETDLMSIEAVGGSTGTVGTVVSGIWKETPSGTTDVGTDGPAFDPGDPGIPPFDPPDFEVPDIPGGGGITEPPNTEDPLINCDTTSGADLRGIDDPLTGLDAPWRHLDDGAWTWDTDGRDIVAFNNNHLTDDLWYNTTEPMSARTSGNDTSVGGAGLTFSFSGRVQFCEPNSYLTVSVESVDGPVAFARFHGFPGYLDDNGSYYGVFCGTQHQNGHRSGGAAPHEEFALDNRNNGGIDGSAPGLGELTPFSVSFDLSGERQKVFFSGDFGSGYMEDYYWSSPPHPHVGGTIASYGLDTGASHVLHLHFIAGDFGTPGCPCIRLVLDEMGTACEANPDYEPPASETP